MYSTCIFCNQPLGRNEALENFQVGRRLAYDAAKGRLWVICAKCERWNLTPLESRWEAIEEAERLYRASRLRVATDNIGLAQLREGLGLVRIGAPPKLELAGWRYGDQFGRRMRKQWLYAAAGFAAAGASLVFPLLNIAIAGTGAHMLYTGISLRRQLRHNSAAALQVRDNAGKPLYLSHEDARASGLSTSGGDTRDWRLMVRHREILSSGNLRAFLVGREKTRPAKYPAVLTGEAAHRALARMMPLANYEGGRAKRVREAVDMIGSAGTVNELLYRSASNRQYTNVIPGQNALAGLPPRFRLALEMVLHEDDERRALEGEMAELEERWREAEEIASIADSLLVPDDVEERLTRLKRTPPV